MSDKPYKILLVEQDDLIRPLAAEWLSAAGYEVETAAGADQAGAEAGEPCAAARADVIVVDLPAPRADGAATVRVLRRANPGASVLATSACFHTGIGGCMDAAGRLGVARVLAKPYTREQLLAAVQQAFREGQAALAVGAGAATGGGSAA